MTTVHPAVDITRTPLRRALVIVDASGVAERIEALRGEDRSTLGRGPGGRRRIIPDRAILAIWLMLAINNEAMLVDYMARFLTSADPATLDELGIERSAIAPHWYSRCWRSLHALLDVVDPHPIRRELGGDRRTKMTKVQWAEVLAARDPEDAAVKAERLAWVTTALIEASVQACPRDIRRRWEGNIAVDGTKILAWGKHGTAKRSQWVASEPDAGWYCRDGDHGDSKSNGPRIAWAYEGTLVSMTPNTGAPSGEFPLLALDLGVDQPGREPGFHATALIRSIVDRGYPTGLAIGDQSYLPNSLPWKYQSPVRALGYGHVGEYPIDMPAITVVERGAIQVDGNWFCPSMPKPLIEASVDLRAGTIDGATWRARINRRTAYKLRPNGKEKADGSQRLLCPAAGPSATVACPLKGPATKPGLVAVTITPKHPDKICTQHSITVAAAAGAKWAQALQYGTELWRSVHGHRNVIESWNAYLKDESKGALDSSGRRRVRGRTAATLFATMSVVAANLRRIESWNKKAAKAEKAGLTKAEPKPKKMRRRDLEGSWGEESPLRRATQGGPAPPAAA